MEDAGGDAAGEVCDGVGESLDFQAAASADQHFGDDHDEENRYGEGDEAGFHREILGD